MGTTFLGEEPSQTDATVVRKLREAGAVVIGIANMHELGIGTTGCNSNRCYPAYCMLLCERKCILVFHVQIPWFVS